MGQFTEAWRNGQVVRKHTMENIRAENVGEHTWGVIMLLMVAWPKVPVKILVCAQVHDAGERATGDMPGPTKWANPKMAELMDALETTHIYFSLPTHVTDHYTEMSDSEWAVIEFFDRAEFCVSMARERRLGNTYAMTYFKNSYTKMMLTFREHLEAFQEMDVQLVIGMQHLRGELDTEFVELMKLGG